ncbi:unnamed protein product, partial [Iphiclides podalirius]
MQTRTVSQFARSAGTFFTRAFGVGGPRGAGAEASRSPVTSPGEQRPPEIEADTARTDCVEVLVTPADFC